MTLQLREGGFYKTRDGRKVGPVKPWLDVFEIIGEKCSEGNAQLWCSDGGVHMKRPGEESMDLIAEWTDGPVRTVTRREVVSGQYGRLKTLKVSPSGVSYTKAIVSLEERFYSREDLKEIIDLLAEVRDGLELAGALDSE